MPIFMTGCEVDDYFHWSYGRAERLARRGLLPFILTPAKDIVFDREALDSLCVSVPAKAEARCELCGMPNIRFSGASKICKSCVSKKAGERLRDRARAMRKLSNNEFVAAMKKAK